jgi:hypothetical protein
MAIRLLLSLLGALVLSTLAASPARADREREEGEHRVRAPELDGQTAALGLSLVAGAVAAIRGRKARSSK